MRKVRLASTAAAEAETPVRLKREKGKRGDVTQGCHAEVFSLIPFCALLVSFTRHGGARRALLLFSSLAALSLWPWRCAFAFFLFHL